jgi:putative membrane protein
MDEKMGPNHSKKSACRPPAILEDDRIFLAWQRSHMANERTFLAWSRTSVSLLAFGFVIERLDLFLKYQLLLAGGQPHVPQSHEVMFLSLVSFGLAGVLTLISGLRFLRVRRHINMGEPEYSVVPDILVVLSVIVIIVIAVVLSVQRLAHIV